jgi:CheY-like chemotaxis protein
MLGINDRRELPTLLLIDDDLVSREVIATILTLHGYIVHTAADGAASLEMLDSGECAPGAILMDTQLPGLSGLPLIEQLRTRGKAIIIAISGSPAPDDLVAAADGFLLKPFAPETLQRLLEERNPEPAVPLADAAEPAVNPETLAQFRQLMPEPTVREIYVAVMADLKKRIVALEAAFKLGDAAEIRRIGHTIKGGCGMAGAMRVSRLGALLESEGDKLDNCAAVLSEFESAVQDLERMLNAEFPA